MRPGLDQMASTNCGSYRILPHTELLQRFHVFQGSVVLSLSFCVQFFTSMLKAQYLNSNTATKRIRSHSILMLQLTVILIIDYFHNSLYSINCQIASLHQTIFKNQKKNFIYCQKWQQKTANPDVQEAGTKCSIIFLETWPFIWL